MARFTSAFWLLSALMVCFGASDRCSAGVITGVGFDLKTPGFSTTPASVSVPVIVPGATPGADGVAFTATLTVVGGPGPLLSRDALGVGVSGGAVTTAVDGIGAEFLTVSMALSGITGGTVVFDGFTAIELNSFSGVAALSDDAVLGGDFQSILDDFPLTTKTSPIIPSAIKTSFSILPGTVLTAFQLGALVGQFTTSASVAVPEPSTFLALSGFAAVIGIRRIRRGRQQLA